MSKRFGFGKAEKLKSRKIIDKLFKSGKTFTAFPVRVIYKLAPLQEGSAVQAGVTVSSKLYKSAVKRNKIKRWLREAYRLQKEQLLEAAKLHNRSAAIFFIYIDKNITSFKEVKEAMQKVLHQVERKIRMENGSGT